MAHAVFDSLAKQSGQTGFQPYAWRQTRTRNRCDGARLFQMGGLLEGRPGRFELGPGNARSRLGLSRLGAFGFPGSLFAVSSHDSSYHAGLGRRC